MKALFIGGTGNISTAASRLAVKQGIELWLLNRGNQSVSVEGAKNLVADINNAQQVSDALKNHHWDVVVNWIAFEPGDVLRDIELFRGKTKQYIFISSASAYQKPVSHPVITESTPLCNPFWDYSRNKIACEEVLNLAYRDTGFPITLVRPSLTYQYVIPVAIGSWNDYTIIDRIKQGKPVIVHGDGTSLWTITHSEDFAVAFVGLMGHQQAIGHAFHITSDEILSWNQIYEAVAQAAGAPLNAIHIPSDFIADQAKKIDWIWMGGDFMRGNLHGDKAASVIFDNTKIKSFVPEFKAVIPFNKGIKRTVEWFEAEKSRMVVHADYNRFMDTIINAYNR